MISFPFQKKNDRCNPKPNVQSVTVPTSDWNFFQKTKQLRRELPQGQVK